MMFTQTKNLMILAVLTISVLLLVGCSDDESNPIISSDPEPALDIVETAKAAGNFTTLLAAAEAADLVDALKSEGPLTLFAPTDDAFAALPEGTLDALLQDIDALTAILTYHVVPGAVTAEQVVTLSKASTLNGAEITITASSDGSVMVDGANVIATDIEASNGIIHVIDAVIIPGADQVSGKRSDEGRIPIYALANKAGLKTLAAAIRAAGLQRTLTVEGPFTVFAPTDEAFAALPPGALDALLQDPAALTDILLYHVVAGVYEADDVVNLTEAPTLLDNKNVSITVNGDMVMINDATVLAVDIMARNGVVHVIDGVLLPPTDN